MATFETLDAVPVEMREQYGEFTINENGQERTVYKDLETIEALKQQYRLTGEVSSLTSKFNEFKSKQDEMQAQALAAQKEADEKAWTEKLEAAKAENNAEAAVALYKEQFSVERDTLTGQINEFKTAYESLQSEVISGKKSSYAKELAALYADDKARPAVERLLEMRMKSDDSGVVAMTNGDGVAVPHDNTAILAMLASEPMFQPFAKTAASDGGIVAKGGRSAMPSGLNNKKYSDMTSAEKVAYLKAKNNL